MSWTAPTVTEFKDFFVRDFYFAQATDPNNLDYVVSADVTRAINEAKIHFNDGLFEDEAKATNVFMYLVAFYLVRNIQNSTKGLSSQTKFPISSTHVGGVGVNFVIPEPYQKSPYVNSFAQNGYGLRYLELVWPYACGNVTSIQGATGVMRWE